MTGKVVKLKMVDGAVEDGWVVTAGPIPGEEGRPLSFLIQMDRQAKKTRVASDV